MSDRTAPNTRYVARKRRVVEDRRFVSGRGAFVQDLDLPGMLHVALVASPHPRATLLGIDTEAALASPGVHYVLTGDELAEASNPLPSGLVLPNVRYRPLAHGITRYAGEWVAAVVADSRALAEDAAELVEVSYDPLPAVVDIEATLAPDAPLVHPDHGSNELYHGNFVWGPVEEDFAKAAHRLSFRTRWGRNAAVPLETFGAVARWDDGNEMLEVWASIQMPYFPDQIAGSLRLPPNAVRVHYDVDVGGSYGTKRGIKHTVLVGYLARKLDRPVRLIEDRLDNMAGGDSHGPDRLFDVDVAFEDDATIRSMKIRAIDDVGAYPGRAPFQLAKPISAICGPYRVNSVAYEPVSVVSNKAGQVPVRGFGQSPTNHMIETMIEKVARHRGLDRLEVRRRNLVRSDEFPWEIPSGSKYDSGDYHTVLQKALDLAPYDDWVKRRDAIRGEGRLAGIGIATCLEPSGGNSIFETLMNPQAGVTNFMEGCRIRVDAQGRISAQLGTSSAGQGHETLVATVVGEELEQDPDTIRVTHADSLESPPSQSPVASRMAIMLGGAAAGAAQRIKAKLIAIAAHDLGVPADGLDYEDGVVFARADPAQRRTLPELAAIAYRYAHRMPDDMEPGLQADYVMRIPAGARLPDENQKVPIYPCFSFQAHLVLVEIDPGTGRPTILDYVIAHDCGTMINPDIVRGMVVGGISQGIGAALYEKFDYDADGNFLSATFADYLIPSVHEIPMVRDVDHCTPSPLTSHGQKGSGEGGYLGAPAAVASAVNDALAPRGLSLDALPMRMARIEELLNGDETT